MAANQNYYRVLFDPATPSDNKQILKKLAESLDLGEEGYANFLKKFRGWIADVG